MTKDGSCHQCQGKVAKQECQSRLLPQICWGSKRTCGMDRPATLEYTRTQAKTHWELASHTMILSKRSAHALMCSAHAPTWNANVTMECINKLPREPTSCQQKTLREFFSKRGFHKNQKISPSSSYLSGPWCISLVVHGVLQLPSVPCRNGLICRSPHLDDDDKRKLATPFHSTHCISRQGQGQLQQRMRF